MAAISRESTARMAQKMMYFRPPMPAFNVGDAVELQVRCMAVQPFLQRRDGNSAIFTAT